MKRRFGEQKIIASTAACDWQANFDFFFEKKIFTAYSYLS